MKKLPPMSKMRKEAEKWSGETMNKWWYKPIRIAGLHVGRALLHTPVSANFLTIFMLLCWIAAGGLMAANYFVIGFIFMLLGEFVDYFDGIVARGKNQVCEITGAFLDTLYHQLSAAFVILGLGFGFYFSLHNFLYLLAGVFGCISLIITHHMYNLRNFFFIKLDTKENKEKHYGANPFSDQKLSKTMQFLYTASIKPMKWFIVVFFVFMIFGYLNLMVLFYGIFLTLRVIALYVFLFISVKNRDAQLSKH